MPQLHRQLLLALLATCVCGTELTGPVRSSNIPHLQITPIRSTQSILTIGKWEPSLRLKGMAGDIELPPTPPLKEVFGIGIV